jgi:hypothetical protein
MRRCFVVVLLSALCLIGCTTPCGELRDACDRCTDASIRLSCEEIALTGIQESCELWLDTLDDMGCP